jgi:hypothetical protein
MTRTVNMDVPDLPSNPTYLEFEFSDGDPSKWPSETSREVNSEGIVNFSNIYLWRMEKIFSGESKLVKLLLKICICLVRIQPRVYNTNTEPASVVTVGPKYVLKSFPDGYRFFDHHKGPPLRPRQDVYLYGALVALSPIVIAGLRCRPSWKAFSIKS